MFVNTFPTAPVGGRVDMMKPGVSDIGVSRSIRGPVNNAGLFG